jgi:4-hydroxybenzoate polyprenyltransferase
MIKTLAFIVELIWLALSIFSFVSGVYTTIKLGISESYLFFIISVISILMYFYRKMLRKKREKTNVVG